MSEKTMELNELIGVVDEVIMSEVESESLLLGLYLFFDTLIRPLNPREFLEFWSSLSVDERVYYIDPSSRANKSRKLTSDDADLLLAVASNMFKVTDLNWWEKEGEE